MKNTAADIDYKEAARFCDTQLETYVSIAWLGNGDRGDDWESDEMGNGRVRFGKWIYYWDDQGFVNLVRYENEAKAVEIWQELAAAESALLDEGCRENGCTACTVCGSFECGSCNSEQVSGSSHVVGCYRR